ncbi:hypothetical protein Syun_015534 [Stephania yunnanensis]|uniref:TF-B3 domain-containing protein n=1 Tax=Stephania yunnanensis TaxID=152371 RepID=A0AAP0JLV5_9MAGN
MRRIIRTGVTKSFHFFKIVSPAAIANRRLGLPKKFSREFGRNLSDVAILKVPTGKDWQIKVRNENGDMFLQEGWQQFKEEYSISAGHFLVFRYEGNSNFHVLIFDMSGSEIGYADRTDKTTTNVRGYKKSNTVDSDEDSVKIIGASPVKREQNMEMVVIGSSSFSKTEIERRRLTAREKKRTVQEAKSLKTQHPSFTVVMRPSYVNHHYSIIIFVLAQLLPLGFAKRYLTAKLESVKLEVADGRTWWVGCQMKHAKLSRGWGLFAKENNLKEGDVCVFELTNKKDNVLKVHIFRGT